MEIACVTVVTGICMGCCRPFEQHMFKELQILQAIGKRDGAWEDAKRKAHMMGWRIVILGAALSLIWLLGSLHVNQASLSTYPGRMAMWGALYTWFCVFLFAPMWLNRGKMRRCLREHLVRFGFAVCLDCGYDLRGQTVSRCPECGKRFDAKELGKSKEAAGTAAENPADGGVGE